MSINYINTGTAPNAGNGDSLRTAFNKINANFSYLGTATVGPTGPVGPGVPAGGLAGQVLAKIDGSDYNTYWVDQTGGGGSTATIDGGFADNSVAITITTYTLSNAQYDASGSFTYNIHFDGAVDAGVIITGVTIPNVNQTISGATSRGDNTVGFQALGEFWQQMVNVVAFAVDSRGYTFYTPPVLWDVPFGPCLVEGTQITMADGSHKAIEHVQHGDLIRVWNFDIGEFAEAQPIWIKCEEETTVHYRFTFSDGTVLRTVGHHVFNKEAGAFTKFIENTTPVGTTTFNEHGKEVTLVSKEKIAEPTRYYNVWTQYHLNLFANGILTSNRFNNIYPIIDMKFVKDARTLRSVTEFTGIDEKYISGLRLQEQTYELSYIQSYIHDRLEKTDISNIVKQGN